MQNKIIEITVGISLSVSLLFNAVLAGVAYQQKLKIAQQGAILDIADTSLVLLEEGYNELNSKVQDMNTIEGVIYEAGKHHGIDPLLLTALIKSESNFRPYPKHNAKGIIGMAGINTQVHGKYLQSNPESIRGNILASAEILSHYNKDSNLTLAIARYKGYSKLGKQQAVAVIEDYKRIKNEF